jgi:chromo domain-containing protein 1
MNRAAHPTQAPAPDGSNLDATPDLDELLYSKFGISFKKLATISNTDKPQRAEMFFVWFPGDSELVRNEKELILAFLRKHTSLLFSNSVDVDWERFVAMVKKNTMQGVVLVCFPVFLSRILLTNNWIVP